MTDGHSLVDGSQVIDFVLQLLSPRPARLHIRLLCGLRRLAGRCCLGVSLAARLQQRLRSNSTATSSRAHPIGTWRCCQALTNVWGYRTAMQAGAV